jgi:hypothetical protein
MRNSQSWECGPVEYGGALLLIGGGIVLARWIVGRAIRALGRTDEQRE